MMNKFDSNHWFTTRPPLFSRHTRPYVYGGITLLIVALLLLFWPQHKQQQTLSKPLNVPSIAQHHKAETNVNDIPWTVDTITVGDNLTYLFKTHGLSNRDIADVMTLGAIVKPLNHLTPGHQIKLRLDDEGQLKQLVYNLSMDKNLVIENNDKSITAYEELIPIETHEKYSTATIKHSLFSAGTRAGLPLNLIYKLIDAYAWDVDFAKDIRPGDQLSVLYEDYYHGDNKVASGHILAAAFTNHGKTHSIIRYTSPNGQSAFYTPDGHNVKQRFLRAPVKYTRISSSFNLKRKHPILHRIRAHRGTDYAAHHGTPIHATGKGRIIFRGHKGGYGNAIIIDHGNHYTTLYGHMSRFNKQFKKGRRVAQGDIIGYVGSTGLATANHVHYEFRIHGKYYDPVKVALPKAAPVAKKYRQEFFAMAKKRLDALHLYKTTQLAKLDQ